MHLRRASHLPHSPAHKKIWVLATPSGMALPQDLIARLFINGINQGKLINVHSTVAGTAYLTDDHIQSVIAAHLEEKEGNILNISNETIVPAIATL